VDYKFLHKVIDQIISETRIDDKGLVHTPFTPSSPPFFLYLSRTHPLIFYNHCKGIYSLNEQETEYVWIKYKEGIRTLIDKKELIHKEKVW
jgi:hypothetical protein